MNPAQFLAIVFHELRLFLSDRRAVISTLLVPIGIASGLAWILGGARGSGAAGRIAVQVADDDRSDTSRAIVDGLRKDPNLKVTLTDSQKARESVRTGSSPVALILPSGFGQKAGRAFFAGPDADRPEVLLLHDPSKSAERQMARGLLTQQVMQVVGQNAFNPQSAAAIDEQLASVKASTMDAPDRAVLTDLLTNARRFVGRSRSAENQGPEMSMPATIREEAAGVSRTKERTANVAHAFVGMAVQGLFFYAIDAGLGILRDRKRGVWKRLRAAPLGRATLLGGKLTATAMVSFGVLCAVLGFGALLFKIRVEGSAPGLLALCVAAALMASTFGLLLAALGKTEAQSRGFAIPAVLAMNLLGGAWFPSFLMPESVQTVSLAIPTRWAVDGFDAMLWRGLGIDAALKPAGVLLAFATGFLLFALARFRWDAE